MDVRASCLRGRQATVTIGPAWHASRSSMPHLRQVLLVLVVVAAMYLFASWTGRLLTHLLAFSHYDLFIWIDRLAFLLWGVLAGVVLMRLLTWPFRLLAALALPVLVLLVVPNIAYMRARSLIQ